MRIIRTLKNRIAVLCSMIAMCGSILAAGFLTLIPTVEAEETTATVSKTQTLTLSEEIGKIAYTDEEKTASGWDGSSRDANKQALYGTAFAKSALKFYGGASSGASITSTSSYTVFEYYRWMTDGNSWKWSSTAVNGLCAGNNYWGELGFAKDGTHRVYASNNSNFWAIEWTAPADGTLTIPATTLTINSSSADTTLQMAFTKDTWLLPAREGWTDYAASTTVEKQSFDVVAGDKVYLNMYASGTAGERFVNVTYDPTFSFLDNVDKVTEDTTTLSEEIGKIAYTDEEKTASGWDGSSRDANKQALYGTAFAKSALKFYGGASSGASITSTSSYTVFEYYRWMTDGNSWKWSSTAVNGLCAGNNYWGELGFAKDGTHRVYASNNSNFWAIEWTAPADGTLTIPATTLTINSSSADTTLQMAFTKDTWLLPAREGWTDYAASTTVEKQSFDVVAGDKVYLNMYASGTAEGRFVNVTYDPEFKFEATETIDGISFATDTMYTMTKKLSSVPLTVEADINLPSSTTGRGGVIFGSYSGNGSCFNFEVKENGQLRLYYSNTNSAITDFTFDTDVRQDKWLHVAVSYDMTAGAWTCYIDGVAVGTQSALGVSTYVLGFPFRLGSDCRSGNTSYFKGSIHSLAVYSDTRTAGEIAADMDSVDVNDAALLAYYQTPASVAGYDIADLSANGNTLDCTAPYFKDKEEVTDYAYSFALVGDTQFLAGYDANTGTKYMDGIFDYIIENKDSKKIAHVFHMGDVVNAPVATEYAAAKEAIAQLDGVIPYSVVRGNHDKTDLMNEYFYYDAYTNQFGGFYGENSMLNSWRTFSVAGVNYLFVTLDYGASDEELAWAADIIEAYPNHRVIITTHGYLNSDGKTLEAGTYNPPLEDYDYNANYGEALTGTPVGNTGTQIWEKLVSKHSNIFLVLSGHVPSAQVVTTQRKGENGNTVTEMLIDPQGLDQVDPTGMITMLYFSNDGKTITVETYSTVKQAYYLDSNQYTIDVSDWVPCGEVKATSISAADDFGLNFYVDIADATSATATMTMDGVAEEVVGVFDSAKSLWKFTYPVAAKDYDKTVAFALTSVNGNAITNGVKAEYSVKAYMDAIANAEVSETYTAELKALTAAMETYCEAAKVYFSDNAASVEKVTEGVSSTDLSEYKANLTGEAENVVMHGATLVLESKTVIHVYFTATGDPICTVNGETVEAEAVEGEANLYVLKVQVVARDLDKMNEITVGGYSLDFGAFSYIEASVDTANPALYNVLQALYDYCVAANAYFGE